MIVHRGIIEGMHGSYGSGLGMIIISGNLIPCENAQTVRCLEGCFGHAIGPGYTINNGEDSGFIGQDIVYSLDDMMGILDGFTPTEDFKDRFGIVPEIGELLDTEEICSHQKKSSSDI